MCWITLTPKPKPKHHGHNNHHHPDHGSSVAELVRVHRKGDGARYSKVRIIAPVHGSEKHHHHHHPHIHPLHMHPLQNTHRHDPAWTMHGSGRKRDAAPRPPPSCPPPSTISSTCAWASEPTYKTRIVEPVRREVRETTRIALRESRPDRGRLRRVAGYEVLGREMPWDWDCVSSESSGRDRSAKGENRGRSGRRSSKLRYPPFAGADRWM